MESSSNPLPRFNKCCFVFGLRSGVMMFVSIESLFWAVLSFAAVYSEVKYINNVDLFNFSDELDNDWYYYLIFGRPEDERNERMRTYIVVLNLLLSFLFVLYFVFTLLLLTGISRRSKNFFIPYLVFDVVFLLLTLVLGVVGMFLRLQIARICIFFFFIKFYFAVCVYSLFKDYSVKKSDKLSITNVGQRRESHPSSGETSPVHLEDAQDPEKAPLAVAV